MSVLFRSNTLNIFFGYISMIVAFIYQTLETLVLLLVPRWMRLKRKDITGQKVLITGAGSGLGRCLAVEFSKHATCLLLVDINKESLLQTKKLVEGSSTVFVYECDVSDYRKVYEMADRVKRDVGDVDILVNNAGIVSGMYLTDLPEEKIVKSMEVNALAHFWVVKAFLPSLMKRNSGHLVSITSILSKVGGSKVVDYCASKFAAAGFAESLEIELRERKLDGIKFTTVCPSQIDTGLFNGYKLHAGTVLSPEYVAKEVLLGILEEREMIHLPYFIRFIFIVKECLPRWVGIRILEMTGNIKGMENFTGRQSKGVNKPLKSD